LVGERVKGLPKTFKEFRAFGSFPLGTNPSFGGGLLGKGIGFWKGGIIY